MSRIRSSCFLILCSKADQRSWPKSEEMEIFWETCLYLRSKPKAKATKNAEAASSVRVTKSSRSAIYITSTCNVI